MATQPPGASLGFCFSCLPSTTTALSSRTQLRLMQMAVRDLLFGLFCRAPTTAFFHF